MEKPNESGAEPNTPSFDDAVGKEQPVNSIPSGTSKEEQPDKKPDASKPEDQSGETPIDKSESPEDKDKKPEGDKTFWGKFKSEDDAKRSYDEAQTKIIDQGKEINDLKTASEKNQQFLSVLDKALVKNPQLADQLKASIAEAMKASDAEPEDQLDIDTLLDKKLEERETKAKTKTEIDKWIADHEDFKTPEIGHQILDLIEKEKLPFNARTLQLAYDSVTKDSQTKKAADEALKKEEVKNLERENASGVGGGQPATKGKTDQESPFDDLVGESINPNKVR
ncbi:MAG: hypothetical protein COV08_01370 [Candidatus Vogelbacteria bacterium CG10_big_fil_rev_8_21_14_0_10_49_38]|uniref:Scaffolding protein n=1 Tax=Candidatus Vogelbacteria bacterium CG10_big_fil_rev_8_21_14_0_10_49_38 TaxID=1975043 RepID=A0A2H0RHX3_9BACT|nr:MAG: hypothetical protein BK006_01390 [bacterium CG10_49_38]PIR46129.1 MAG: hypothetical protein COV08_01370 [Candidatus Vogelbacteria bacterium CG10_big_fil_rev_8_21_14_0_10_49_38]